MAHDSVTISWTAPGSGSAVSPATGSCGELTPDSLSAIAPDTGSTGTEYTDSTVAEETTYHYAVLALSQDGDGAQSATVSATTGAAPQDKGSKGSQKGDPEGSIGTRDTHAVPPNLAVEPGDGRLTFTWDEPVITSVHTIVHYSYQYGKTTDSSLTDGDRRKQPNPRKSVGDYRTGEWHQIHIQGPRSPQRGHPNHRPSRQLSSPSQIHCCV